MQGLVELAVAAAVEPMTLRWPEEHGIGAVPVWRAKLASLANRAVPAVRPISSAAVNAPQPVSASSCGRCAWIKTSSPQQA